MIFNLAALYTSVQSCSSERYPPSCGPTFGRNPLSSPRKRDTSEARGHSGKLSSKIVVDGMYHYRQHFFELYFLLWGTSTRGKLPIRYEENPANKIVIDKYNSEWGGPQFINEEVPRGHFLSSHISLVVKVKKMNLRPFFAVVFLWSNRRYCHQIQYKVYQIRWRNR